MIGFCLTGMVLEIVGLLKKKGFLGQLFVSCLGDLTKKKKIIVISCLT